MLSGYRKIDMENWPRKDHYEYYTEKLKVEYNITVRVQVDKLLDFCHSRGYRFYPSLICIVTQVLNGLENFRMFRDKEGELCVWDYIVPNYTFFHADDNTFSDCWSEYSPDFDTFYKTVTEDMERYKNVKGVKARAGQPGNFYCISCEPWTDFTAYGARSLNGEPKFFPIITMGKYVKENGRTTMPVNLLIAHAVSDGYHAGLFFNSLQEAIDNIDK